MPWVEGQSGNPAGRKAEDRKLKLLCRQYTEKAITKIVEFLDSENPLIALSAAKELLDRGYGKAKQSIEGKFEHEHTVTTGDASSLSSRLRPQANGTDHSVQ